MTESRLTLTRQELYDRVWSEPVSKVAPKLGLSDVGLAKLCRRYEIPTPPVGHWAKLEHGKPSPKPGLPELDDEDRHEIQLFRARFEAKPDPTPVPRIEVGDRLSRPHRLVDQTRRRLRAAKAEKGAALSVDEGRRLDILVTRKSLTRALCLMDALIKYWEKSGGSVSAGTPATTFSREGDSVSISLKEQFMRHEVPSEYRYSKQYKHEATGSLSFSIDLWGDGLRKTWSDGKVQRLEDLLGSVAVGLDAWIVHLRQRRLDRECEERQQRIAKERRAFKQEWAEAESARRENLETCISNWDKSQKILAYLTALDAAVENGEVKTSPEGYSRWREWAQWYAMTLCPLSPRPNPPSIHRVDPPANTRVIDLDLTSDTRRILLEAGIVDTDELIALSESELRERCSTDTWRLNQELGRVLEGLGY